jgi:DNA-binding cell septation regulator SpoVG
MPAYKNGKGAYQDIAFPITKDFRSKLYGAILDTYKVEREKPREMTPAKEAEKSGDKEFSDIGSKEELPFR